jgi:hypothetical protein
MHRFLKSRRSVKVTPADEAMEPVCAVGSRARTTRRHRNRDALECALGRPGVVRQI